MPVTNRVGEENDGWRVTNVTLRFERGTAFAQHIITLRSQLRRLVVRASPATGAAWDDPGLRRHVGRLDAGRGALAHDPAVHHRGRGDRHAVAAGLGGEARLQRAQPGARRARRCGCSAAARSAPAAPDDADDAAVVHDYLWSFQYTIAAGTSQIQRNLIAERILGMPKGR